MYTCRTSGLLFENVCIYPGWKYETLNCARHLSVDFFRFFLHNLDVLISNICQITFFGVLHLQISKTKHGFSLSV